MQLGSLSTGTKTKIAEEITRVHPAVMSVPGKCVLQEECVISAVESDLGERIQQLDDRPPSHIIGPAIYKTRRDVARLFARTLGTDHE